MLKNIKTKLWRLLENKEVSLAMIFNRRGEIPWKKGRPVRGNTIEEGIGFSKTLIKQAIDTWSPLEEENVVVVSRQNGLPESAAYLNLKSLMILPVSREFFLYLDSGVKEVFSTADREAFKLIGELLGESIDLIKEKQTDAGGVSGQSKEIEAIRDLVLKYSLEEEPVMIRGETGCGKNHIAELIHRFSGRKGKFITIHTPGIPEELFESEIFGHTKGAFTGASAHKKGLVEEAEGGTLFLDEIAEVPPSFQARLLRFIDTRRYLKLGCTGEKTADVRIVAATNRDLAAAIKEKSFREDLYFRLHILEIKIPPLRERKEDIKSLVMEEQRLMRGKKPGDGFWEALQNYEWPGNIRELKSVLLRLGIHGGDRVTGSDVTAIIKQTALYDSVSPGDRVEEPTSNIDKKVNGMWQDLCGGLTFWEAVKKKFLARDVNRDEVKQVVAKGMDEAGGKYKNLLGVFNLPEDDYHRFMAFLSDYGLK